MKKVICWLIAAMMVAALAGCSSGSNSASELSGSSESPKQPVSPQTEESKEVEPNDSSGESEAETPRKATIAESVLVDESDIKITATEIDYSSFMGPELKLLIENNSDQNLTVQVRDTSVNGCMVSTTISADVASGKKANDGISILSSSLEKNAIETIADIEFYFHIFTTEGWDDYLNTEVIRVETSAADGFEYVYDDSGDVLYEAGGLKIVSKGMTEEDSIYGPGVLMYIENLSEKKQTVQVRDVSVNGFMIDPIFSAEVAAGKRIIDGMTFFKTKLEENNIEKIEEIEFSFHIFSEDFGDERIDTEAITLTFEAE